MGNLQSGGLQLVICAMTTDGQTDKIVPAILPRDLDDLIAHLEEVKGVARLVQIDVVDGKFAPTRTWPYEDRESFEEILSEEQGMPLWEDFDFEVDLMVEKAKDAALEWVRAGASRIIVHIESPDSEAALAALQEYRAGEMRVEVGVALSLATPLDGLVRLAPSADFIQVMGIAEIGKQGEPFDARALLRIEELRDRLPSYPISVDGGVELENAPALIEAGATRLVAGSAIFDGDARENYKKLKLIVHSE